MYYIKMLTVSGLNRNVKLNKQRARNNPCPLRYSVLLMFSFSIAFPVTFSAGVTFEFPIPITG